MKSPSLVRRLAATAFVAAFALLALGAVPAAAQDATPPSTSAAMRTITVTGHGAVTVKPDVANVTLGVTNTSKTLEAAQEDVSTRLAAVLRTLEERGIAKDDIQTAGYNVSIQYEYDNNGNMKGIAGYTVSSGLNVTVRKIDDLGVILDQAVTAGANLVSNVSFDVSDPSKPASQARDLAVKDARAKADEYAKASGTVIVGVYSIEETSAPQPAPRTVAMAAPSASAEKAVPVAAGTTEVDVDITIVFEIAQPNG